MFKRSAKIKNGFRRRGWLGAMLVFWIGTLAQAEVSLINGNLYQAFTDISFDQLLWNVTRVYNSVNTRFVGWFGPGWGSFFEAYVEFFPDSTLIAHEYGSGEEVVFVPEGKALAGLTDSLEAFVKALAKAVGNESADYQRRLKEDSEFRRTEFQRHASKIQLPSLKEGTHYVGLGGAARQVLVVEQEGAALVLKRSYGDGLEQVFNSKGQLIRVRDRNGNEVRLSYLGNKIVFKNESNTALMTFLLNERGRVTRIEAHKRSPSLYSYNAFQELVESQDSNRKVYKYGYTPEGRHNLNLIQEIQSPSKKSKQAASQDLIRVEYYPDNHPDARVRDTVKSLWQADQGKFQYAYAYDTLGAGSVVVTVQPEGSGVARKYTWSRKKRPDGSWWIEKEEFEEGTSRRETLYASDYPLPIQIRRWKEGKALPETRFVYDKGRLTQKTSAEGVTELVYDPRFNKIAQARVKTAVGEETHVTYQYDDKANLIEARSKKGNQEEYVKLSYDPKGNVKAFTDQAGRNMVIEYDEHQRPIRIRQMEKGPTGLKSVAVLELPRGDDQSLTEAAKAAVARSPVMVKLEEAYASFLKLLQPASVSLD